jgi:hypothetical protein
MAQEIKRNIPRDVFLHLLAIVTLYWSAVSFVTLMWQYINYFFPDVLNTSYYMGFSGPIRFAVSSLIIVFPVFISVSWYLNKIYRKESAVRESKIRKWLIYLTLFIASIVIIGDLVSTINTLLGGEITIRFTLKALSILSVAAAVFGYYLDDVRRDTPTKSAKYFAWVSGIIILVTIVGAFFIIGSPATARLIQFDQQRMSDLMGVQAGILNYWQSKEKLPNSLSDLYDSMSGYTAPNDPETGVPYEYKIKNATNLTFELCATFSKEGKSNPNGGPVPITKNLYSLSWDHSAGRVCFERTIDRQFYPPLNKTK